MAEYKYEDLIRSLSKAIDYILAARNPNGSWGDVRSTALSIWALQEVIESNIPNNVENLLLQIIKESKYWLKQQIRIEDGGISWESEVWDTSTSIIALLFNPSPHDNLIIDQAVAWLKNSADPVWVDDIWESLLATVSLIRKQKRSRGAARRDLKWLEDVFEWICRIPSIESTGEFICPHYTGMIVWVYGELQFSGLIDNFKEKNILNAFRQKVEDGIRFLLKHIEGSVIDPWSKYTFSNAYIAYALSTLPNIINQSQILTISNWFSEWQKIDGNFEDIEDSALAILALIKLKQLYTKCYQLENYHLSINITYQPKVTCFLGYCSKAEKLAIAFKEFIKIHNDKIEILDWREDINPGDHLYKKIKDFAQKAQISIFILTPDNILTLDNGVEVAVPRDNIIFEIGYFAATIGIKRTLLIIEDGVKIPDDIQGIIYIQLKVAKLQNNKDENLEKVMLENAKHQLLDALDKIIINYAQDA